MDGSAEQHGRLKLMVERSLDVLSRKEFKKTFEEMFRSFCVLRKPQRANGHMLQKLWGLSDLREARKVAEVLDELSLAQITRDHGNVFYVEVHELIVDIAMAKASEKGKVKACFRTLVDNYISKEYVMGTAAAAHATEGADTPGVQMGIGIRSIANWAKRCFCRDPVDVKPTSIEEDEKYIFRSWWDVEDDRYIHDNLCRMLQGAGESDELLWLLERAKWIVKRLQTSGSMVWNKILKLDNKRYNGSLANTRKR